MSRIRPNGIRIRKTRHLAHAHVSCVAYTSLTKPSLIEHVWTGENILWNWEQGTLLTRRSFDNGRTWKVVEKGHPPKQVGNRLIRKGQPVYHLDPVRKVLLRFHTQTESWVNMDDCNFGPDAAPDYLPMRTGRIFFSISRDEGETWSPERQIIQKGRAYNSVHWAEGMFYEKNSASFGELFHVVQRNDGTLLLPVGITLLDARRRLIRLPDRFGDVIWPVEACACLLGRWRKDGRDLEWDISNTVTCPEYMSRDLCEPAVAEVDDGKLMMLMRGSSGPRQAFTGVKFFAISKDGGKTWGPAVPLTYPSGDPVHSPGSLANLFRAARNGKLYVIANILKHPVRQCDPRYPLVLAEVDPKYYWVLPESETVIADRLPRHPSKVRFSNWQRIEDRETGNPVLYLNEQCADAILPGTPGHLDHYAWRYEIQLPHTA